MPDYLYWSRRELYTINTYLNQVAISELDFHIIFKPNSFNLKLFAANVSGVWCVILPILKYPVYD